MIEIYRKGQRLDIPTDQVVTFKKSQNLNGVQERYAYSNTVSLEKTANIRKLLDLPDLPVGKGKTLQNGYEVDIVLNGSIHLKNQTLKINKETEDKVDLYILYSDNALVTKLKATYVNAVTEALKYKKTRADLLSRTGSNPALDPTIGVFTQTQSAAGQYVIEEMPILINLQWLVKKIFTDNAYSVYGDFFLSTNSIKEFYVAPNAGIYQVYAGGDGFSPSFDTALTAFDLLNQTLAFFNCYASVDDTNRTVIINQWTNLSNYKENYKDYSRFFINSKDFAFQSKLAKRNLLTYADSEPTFNSFFSNNLSSEDSATYLASKFGSGSTKLFDDSELQEDGTIELRANGEPGETSALRIYKISATTSTFPLFVNGQAVPTTLRRAASVSMRDVYNAFHKGYTDFILTPLIQNLEFRYDGIMATDFSLTEVFFIKQQSAYWIPLEINFSTKKDKITVKAMLIKQRKVASPILNNFNTVLLDFRQKVIFPKTYLLSMYPMPPNEYEWDEVVFIGYDQTKNSLFVNNVLVPAASLPQAFSLSALGENSIVFEANQPGDTTPDTASDSMYIQAVDTNGGVSNVAYINLKHTGRASLESNFLQPSPYDYFRNNFDEAQETVNVLHYVVGPKPNINNTVTSVQTIQIPGYSATDPFNLIVTQEQYASFKVKTKPFEVFILTHNNGVGKARASVRLILHDGAVFTTLAQWASANDSELTHNVPAMTFDTPPIPAGRKIRLFFIYLFENHAGSNSGSINIRVKISNFGADISTIKTVI